MRIALAGNPNSGKTTMYNALTGSNEKVGNWAGVTVDKKERRVRKIFYTEDTEIIAVDLPGAYSMSPFTSEESVTRDYVQNENPDAIINIVDATNLSRSLFFTTQLLELGIPMVIALNKADINKRKETEIDVGALSHKLGCPVIETVSTSKKGLKEVMKAVVSVLGKKQKSPFRQENVDLTDREAVFRADRARFEYVNTVVTSVETRKVYTNELNKQDKVDAVLTGKRVGIPIFALVMLAVFWISQSGPAVWLADLITGWMEAGQEALAEAINSDSVWASILIDGIIGGVIAVVGFLPLVMVMYFLIALLEDCGYMARATVVLDPIFKKVGLSGKSIIPFIIGTGCAIPGVMACRTIRNERERRSTAILAPFMPCGAKLPVISLFAGAFFGDGPWVGALMYFAAIAIIFLCALLVNLITGYKNKKSYFIMELPEYRLPSLKKAVISMGQRGWAFIVKAGTVILVCNFAVHLMQNFTWSLSPVGENADSSILATIAQPFAYFIAPVVGVVAWQLAASSITGFIAKENVVGTLAVCYGISNFFDLEELQMIAGAEADVSAVLGISKIAALAFLTFNLFTPPCFAAMGAMSAELKSKKWFLGAIGLQIAVGYTVAFLVNFFGTVFSSKVSFTSLWMPILGWCVVITAASVITYIIIRNQKRFKSEAEAKASAKKTVKA